MANILLVEDQPTLRQLISEILGFSGYQVTSVAGGREALELLQSGAYFPNLILSDLLMDSGNGDELLEAVRSEWLWREIPFILMSGKEQIEALRMELKYGVQGYLEKPFGIADFLALVQKVISAPRSNSDQQSSDASRLA
jgi:CheY-like chemotaxis protein